MSRKLIPFAISFVFIFAACSKDEDSKPGSGGGIPETEVVKDIDNNTYPVVQIGTQKWMKQNLRTTRYNNGDTIANNTNTWNNLTSGAWAYYNNNPQYNTPYGKLYNFYAVSDNRKLCPSGWRVPNNSDWNILIKTVDPLADTTTNDPLRSSLAGGYLKSTGTIVDENGLWDSPNLNATDKKGFSVVPAGVKSNTGFSDLSFKGVLWASSQINSQGYSLWFDYDNDDVYRYTKDKTQGYSVRCIKE